MASNNCEVLSSTFHGPRDRFQLDRFMTRFGNAVYMVFDLDDEDEDCPGTPKLVGYCEEDSYRKAVVVVGAAIARLCGEEA